MLYKVPGPVRPLLGQYSITASPSDCGWWPARLGCRFDSRVRSIASWGSPHGAVLTFVRANPALAAVVADGYPEAVRRSLTGRPTSAQLRIPLPRTGGDRRTNCAIRMAVFQTIRWHELHRWIFVMPWNTRYRTTSPLPVARSPLLMWSLMHCERYFRVSGISLTVGSRYMGSGQPNRRSGTPMSASSASGKYPVARSARVPRSGLSQCLAAVDRGCPGSWSSNTDSPQRASSSDASTAANRPQVLHRAADSGSRITR